MLSISNSLLLFIFARLHRALWWFEFDSLNANAFKCLFGIDCDLHTNPETAQVSTAVSQSRMIQCSIQGKKNKNLKHKTENRACWTDTELSALLSRSYIETPPTNRHWGQEELLIKRTKPIVFQQEITLQAVAECETRTKKRQQNECLYVWEEHCP